MTSLIGIMGRATVFAASLPVGIDDIIELRKVGRLTISPDGGAVAYLVIHAITAKDAYSISLVVTSAQDITRRKELIRIEIPAVRSQDSGIDENIGSYLTGGLVFTWRHTGNELIYGVPFQGETDLFEYSSRTQTTKHLWKIHGDATALTDLAEHGIGYCILQPAALSRLEDRISDPAYRYDESTFHASDKHPWQDGRGYEPGTRPYFNPAPPETCFAENLTTRRISTVPNGVVLPQGPPSPRYSKALGAVGPVSLDEKIYQGHPVIVAIDSPDRRLTLYGARVSSSEAAGVPEEADYFVEENGTANPAQTLIFKKGTKNDETTEGKIDRFFWSSDSKAIIYFRSTLDHTRIFRFDIKTGKETPLLSTDWGFDGPTNMSPDGRFLYQTRERPNVPAQLSRIDLQTGQMLLIDEINRQFQNVQVPTYISVRQINQYGDELTGYLFMPPGFHGQNRLPFVAIKSHIANAFCNGGTGDEFPGMVMAMKGYAVLFFSPGGRNYVSKKGDAEYSLLRFKSPIENIRLVIADLDKKRWVDPKKTGIAGLSFGADIVSYAAGFSDVFAVGEATGGDDFSPANYFFFGTTEIEAFSKRWGLPYPDETGMPAWEKLSTALNASRSNMPLLFQPPDSEASFILPHHIAWQRAGLPVDTYVYPDEGHIKIHPVNRYYAMTRNLQWFDFWLRGVEDPRPEFADQFKRWEKMRTDWNAKQDHHDLQPEEQKPVR